MSNDDITIIVMIVNVIIIIIGARWMWQHVPQGR